MYIAKTGEQFAAVSTGKPQGKETLRLRAYAVLAASDILAIGTAFIASNVAYWHGTQSGHGIVMFALIAPIYLGMAMLTRAYTVATLGVRRYSLVRAIQALVYSASAILFIAYFLKAGAEFSRGVFALGMCGSLILVAASRFVLHRPLLKTLGGAPHMTIVVRDGADFVANPGDITLSADSLAFDPTTNDPFHFHEFARVITPADRVLVACLPERQAVWTSVLKSLTVDGEIVTSDDVHGGVISIGEYAGRKTLVVTTGPLGLRDRAIKRAFDLSLALLAGLVLAPFLLAAAIAIRLESRGSVLFVQNRIGRDNRIFRMYKFRSMYSDMCDAQAHQLTCRSDPRVTRVGEFIRRTSIDELPQLLNILKGDMSIVGPRPHPLSAKAADKLYWDVDPRYRHRHSIKPGLTGLAQIRGYRGNTERAEDLTNRLQADLEYVASWSFSRDLQIIFQTLRVLRHSNAY